MDVEAIKVFSQFGFPAIVAGMLLWFVTTRLNGKLDALVQRMEEHSRATWELKAAIERLIDRLPR
jgi:hypothetical protein